jgi:hypothetical protein
MLRMIGALRSRNRWKQGLSGGWLLIAAELVHDANAAKAKTANFDGRCRVVSG